ncbi:14325_t:CDS:1, partial [Funneliformis geosporum]
HSEHLSNSEDVIINKDTYQIDKRIQSLKEQLEKQYNKMIVTEYNK